MQTWRPRLVAIDIDGTLPAWCEGVRESPEPAGSGLLKALGAAVDAGAHVVLCSGRSPQGMTRVIDRLRFSGRSGAERQWLVAGNGTMVCRYAPLEITHEETFDAGTAVRAFLDRCPSALVAVEHRGVGYRLTAPFPDGELPGEMIVTDLDDLLAEPVSRAIVRDPTATPEEFVRLAAETELPGAEHSVGWSAWLDLTPAGVSKASALRHVCAALGVTASQVLALGDGRNDIPMLQWAGRGVAVAQAPEEVRNAADATTLSAEDDGVAAELRQWFA
ncbi:HAD family hydrolase [Streptomyces albidoflavus]